MVKANYVRSGAGRGATMRASAQYYGHRPDQEGDRTYRPAFDDMGDGLTKEQVYGYVEGKGEEYCENVSGGCPPDRPDPARM